MKVTAQEKKLLGRITRHEATVGIIGLGYVGLPLGIAFAKAGFPVLGYDMDPTKIAALNAGKSYIKHISANDIKAIAKNGGWSTSDPKELAKADAILICVPTPLTRQREPDMSFIINTVAMLADILRPGQLVVLESTTYPGTTREILLPSLEKDGLKSGKDFFLAYSPEREDPGNLGHSACDIPKVVGGLDAASLRLAQALYDNVVPRTVPVSTLEVAEATKLMENIFRCVNIALVNELKLIFTRMNIDVWEVIDAAKSKPFGFMPFYPGPGLGGHCIPIDPFYLSWKAREFECSTWFIELAGMINVAMPEYVVKRTGEELNKRHKSLNGSRLLLVGMAYKKDVDDIRESPSLRLLELFNRSGAQTEYHDPFIPMLPKTRKYQFTQKSVQLTAAQLKKYDAVIVATDHSVVDYSLIAAHASLVIDTRNAMASIKKSKAIIAKA